MRKSFAKKRKSLFRRIVRNFVLILNLCVAIPMLLCYFSTQFSPSEVLLLAFLGLIYPALLVANMLFFILWLIKRRWLALISLITLLLGYNHFNHFFAFHFFPEKENPNSKSITILSYNVRLFDHYNWIKDSNTEDSIINFIARQNADIICLQEFFLDKRDSITVDMKLKKQTGLNYSYKSFAKRGEKIFNYGLAIYSRFPIKDSGVIVTNTRHFSSFVDLDIKNQTIRVYNNHLASIHLGYEDYKLIDNFDENIEMKELQGIRGIIMKILKASDIRSKQVDILSAHFKSSPYPTLVCGDFNDTPVSYAYNKMRGNLKDAFLESSYGFGSTFVNRLSTFRIDYIFHEAKYKSTDFITHTTKLSDHYPITCKLIIENK